MKAMWNKVRLGDVCRVIPGYAFKSSDWQGTGIPVVKIKNISGNNSVDLASTDFVCERLLTPRLQKFVIKDGDILVAMTGATAGKVGRVRTNRLLLLNQRVAKIDPIGADSNFIWSVVSSKEYQERFFYLADGAAQPNMSGGQIEGVEISLPALPIQKRIAGILSAYDELIENSQRRIKILEAMVRTLYREWFVHFRFPGHESVPRVPSPLGEIPQGWEVKKLGEISENFDRFRKPLSKMQRAKIQGNYPYYGAAKVFDYINDFIFEGEYLLMAEDGSVITTERAPVLQLVNDKFWPNNHTHVLLGRPPFSTHFLYLGLSEVDISPYITGAAQPKITQENMNRIPFFCGPTQLHDEFNRLVETPIRQAHIIQRQIQNLRRTRDLLLPRLLTGQINVESLP